MLQKTHGMRGTLAYHWRQLDLQRFVGHTYPRPGLKETTEGFAFIMCTDVTSMNLGLRCWQKVKGSIRAHSDQARASWYLALCVSDVLCCRYCTSRAHSKKVREKQQDDVVAFWRYHVPVLVVRRMHVKFSSYSAIRNVSVL